MKTVMLDGRRTIAASFASALHPLIQMEVLIHQILIHFQEEECAKSVVMYLLPWQYITQGRGVVFSKEDERM